MLPNGVGGLFLKEFLDLLSDTKLGGGPSPKLLGIGGGGAGIADVLFIEKFLFIY